MNKPHQQEKGSPKQLVVGVSGASGSVIAERLVRFLLDSGHHVHLVASKTGKLVTHDEMDIPQGTRGLFANMEHENLTEWGEKNFYAPFASGTAPIDGMAIVPCAMTTVASVAHGISDNLIKRAAEVMLKEGRPLVIVPREAPLNQIHLQNMLTLAQAGATIVPPVLTFYQHPGDSVMEQVDYVVSRILDHLGVDNQLFHRWGTER
ncbi:UbiX family flavin prenyltransferase [Planctomycetota bacterium]|jgi:flavin prenyltransferase|nr:UbiX family flavin prenyltransferase [Planctomycetota bacterium]MDC3251783.1 UbiX family flavin prenyltransferase [Planctomycetota bacterium]NCF98960.1 UbiX family flavin prenyltransferase [Planctomycetia bacterium]NCG12432.1 UbiX family flavin prenyltransferase [Planctomycetia bacterium]